MVEEGLGLIDVCGLGVVVAVEVVLSTDYPAMTGVYESMEKATRSRSTI